MKVVLTDGTRVSLGWQYSQCEKELKHSKGTTIVPQNCTTCFIRVVGENQPVLSEVTITRYHKDADNKPLARKTTFAMAVAEFSKEDKKILWNVFLENIRLPREKTHESKNKKTA